MIEILTTLGGRIVDAGLAAALVSGLVVLAMLTTRQPSRRRALARAGVLGVLLSIPLVYFRPLVSIDLSTPIRFGFDPALSWIADRVGVDPGLAPWRLPRLSPQWIRLGLFLTLVLYLLGVATNLGRFALGWWGSKWIARHSVPPESEVAELYHSLPFPAGRHRPQVRISARTTRPVLLGMFRQTILIPPALSEPAASEALRLSLLHELAHAEASDPWFGLASELAAVFWFPLPPLWWIRSQMRLDQEFLADRQAADRMPTPRAYASSLVEIAASAAQSAPTIEAPSRRSTTTPALAHRVLMLIGCPFPVERRPPKWWRWSVVAILLIVLPIATSMTLRAKSSLPSPRPALSSPRHFSMTKLIVTESANASGPTLIPFRLPDVFQLQLEVFARSSELAEIAILGHTLGEKSVGNDSLLKIPARWHRVVLTRSHAHLALAVDSAPPIHLPGASVEQWISLRTPAERPTTFRSIQITW